MLNLKRNALPKRDLKDRGDLELWLEAFYRELLEDPEMHTLFLEVAGIQLEEHLPRITDFWEQVLWQRGAYRGNPMDVHLELHRARPLRAELFARWLATFERVGRAMFEGPVLETAIERAHSIARIMQMKINNLDRLRKELNN